MQFIIVILDPSYSERETWGVVQATKWEVIEEHVSRRRYKKRVTHNREKKDDKDNDFSIPQDARQTKEGSNAPYTVPTYLPSPTFVWKWIVKSLLYSIAEKHQVWREYKKNEKRKRKNRNTKLRFFERARYCFCIWSVIFFSHPEGSAGNDW